MIGLVCLLAGVLGLAAGGLLRGCRAPETAEGRIVAQTLVGPSGSVVPFADRGELVVPAGAVDDLQTVTIRVYDPEDLDTEELGHPPVRLYAFEPAEMRFRRPVTLQLPTRPDGEPSVAAVVVDGEVRRLVAEIDEEAGVLVVRARDLAFSDAGEERSAEPAVPADGGGRR